MIFPYTRWASLSVGEVAALFRDAPFAWALAGGYAVEQFLGAPIRTHDDIDIIVFRDDQEQLYRWLAEWRLFAADPPGTLRPWGRGEYLATGIQDIWGYERAAQAWQLQIMLVDTDGEAWVSRRHPLIGGLRTDLLVLYHQLPCIRIEVQLLYKAKGNRAKDQLDFQACLPLLTPDAKAWLAQALQLAHPEGHAWQALLR